LDLIRAILFKVEDNPAGKDCCLSDLKRFLN